MLVLGDAFGLVQARPARARGRKVPLVSPAVRLAQLLLEVCVWGQRALLAREVLPLSLPLSPDTPFSVVFSYQCRLSC